MPLRFQQGLGDDPAQPVFMTYVPMKIISAVGGTMGDMSFAMQLNITRDNIAPKWHYQYQPALMLPMHRPGIKLM